jgi:hypothetical protein
MLQFPPLQAGFHALGTDFFSPIQPTPLSDAYLAAWNLVMAARFCWLCRLPARLGERLVGELFFVTRQDQFRPTPQPPIVTLTVLAVL